MRTVYFMLVITVSLAFFSCASNNKTIKDDTENLTLGKVQREIKIGMTSAEVIEVLGSPNLVSTDEERREVWVYDKISSSVTSSHNDSGAVLIFFGAVSSSSTKTTSQKTLTVIIKYDKDGKVRDFAYHTSNF